MHPSAGQGRPGFEPAAGLRLAAVGGPVAAGLHAATEAGVGIPPVALEKLFGNVVDAAAAMAGLLPMVCGFVLALRRLAGATTTPPGVAAMLVTCGLGLVLVAIADHGSRRERALLTGLLARVGLVAVMALLACTPRFSAPGTAVVALTATAASAGGAAALVRRWRRRGDTAQVRAVAVVNAPAATVPPDDDLVQRFERLERPDGSACVRGLVRVRIPAGTRLGVAHVGFCPPLAESPSVCVGTDYDGVEAVVTAAEVLPWGVRIECRLDEPAEETIEIPVNLLASAAA